MAVPQIKRRETGISFEGRGRTKQSFKKECDINHMMRTYQKTGAMPPINKNLPKFGDFSQTRNFHAAVTQVREAETAFGALPSHIRRRFGNDPGELLDFLENVENYQEAADLGLVPPLPPVAKEKPPEGAKSEPDGADKRGGGDSDQQKPGV